LIELVENLTQTALVYGLIGSIFRVYSWTLACVILFFIFSIFKLDHKNKNFIFLPPLPIPFFLINTIFYSLNLTAQTFSFTADLMVFIGGLLTLISILVSYYHNKNGG
jgi:hypothetical protein